MNYLPRNVGDDDGDDGDDVDIFMMDIEVCVK